jgi:predicted NBD/HSP70 family sugar kinase
VKPEENSQIEAWENEARLIAIGLHNCIVMWSPDCLVLGGSLMKSVDIELVKKLVTEQMTIFPKLPEITLSELGEKTGLFGALALMQRDF